MVYVAKPSFNESGDIREWVGLAVRILDGADTGSNEIAIKGAHIRAARALLDWSIEELASRSGVSISTIRRIEGDAALSLRSQSFILIKKSFESSGVEFSITPSGGTAVGLRTQPVSDA